MAAEYQRLRDRLVGVLDGCGFVCYKPRGAYYLMTDISSFGFASDVEFARHLVKDVGVATIPGSSFYADPSDGSSLVRFCFSKREATIREAGARLARLQPVSGRP